MLPVVSSTWAIALIVVLIGTVGRPEHDGALPTGHAGHTSLSFHTSREAEAGEVRAAVGISTLGLSGWSVQSSAVATQSGQEISTPGFDTSDWLSVKPDDAGAPGTEIEALLQNGACPNVFYSDNMEKCFGYMSHIGADTIPRFEVPWWWRTDFDPRVAPGQDAKLVINGVVGAANVFVDGTEVADSNTVEGDYAQYTFDITNLLRPGTNSLAIEILANNPDRMYTLDDVDWNQIPPDNNTGIQFPVQLHISDGLELVDSYTTQVDSADMATAAITVHTDLTNTTTSSLSTTVRSTITTLDGSQAAISVSKNVTIPAGQSVTVSVSPSDDAALDISHPSLWWPYQMGGQPLYTLHTDISGVDRQTGESTTETFGIRSITTYLVGASSLAPQGVRAFAINGRPFVVRGGGWSENLFLHFSLSDLYNQIGLIKNLGLNVIRTEGKEMPTAFYEAMDQAGIMIDAGFQCCDKWQKRGPLTRNDLRVLEASAFNIGQRLRNHPSVMNYSWSDDAPSAKQEAVSLAGFQAAGFQDPIIASAEYKSTTALGPSGEKEGPYDWVPPSYWYDTTHSDFDEDPTITDVGGSWGFDSEQSAGDTVPTMNSLEDFMSPSDLAKLWQDPSYNQYHANYEPGHTGYKFGTLFNFDKALKARYGPWSSLAQYVEEAQVQDYEDTRAQFEAFIDHSTNSPTPSTGTIYWMLNKGWPSLLWNLYNYDYDEAGSYFGAKKANESLHVIFTEDTHTVTVDNLTGATQADLAVTSRVYGLSGNVLDSETSSPITLAPGAVALKVLAPRVPATTVPPQSASVYFVELILTEAGKVVDRNVYWQSTQDDVVNWPNTEGVPHAIMTTYADLSPLRSLPSTSLSAAASTGHAGGQDQTAVTITNPAGGKAVAFFIRADIADAPLGTAPVLWSDDDITLWPGESETLIATYPASLLDGKRPRVAISAWNVAPFTVDAGSAPNGASVAQSVQTERFGLADGAPLDSNALGIGG